MPDERRFVDGARGSDVRVGARDHSVCERVHPEGREQLEAFAEGMAHEIALDELVRIASERRRAERRVRHLLEAAELVGGRRAGQAFGVALVLEHFHERLELGPRGRIVGVEWLAILVYRLEHQARAQVRVVRNGQHVTALVEIEAVVVEAAPEPLLLPFVEVPGGVLRDDVIAEDHIAVQVEGARRSRPLVGHEARERARIAAVVGGLGRRLDVTPARGGALGAAPLARGARGRVLGRELIEGHAEVEAEECPIRLVAVGLARGRVVLRRAFGGAAVHDAEELGVVGDGDEVERPRELYGAKGVARLVVRLDPDPLATRKAIGVRHRETIALQVGVERHRRVHVQIAEIGISSGILVGAATERFEQRIRLRREDLVAASREREQRENDAGANAPAHEARRAIVTGSPFSEYEVPQ